MKFLIAGLGSIGRRHLRHLAALGQEDILLYRTHNSTLPEEDLQQYPVETSLEKALDWGPDGVIVSNPTSLHLDVAIPAAERGLALLLEKPISHTMEGVDELQQAVEANNSKVLVGFQFRYHPGLVQAKKWLEDDRIGKIISFRAHWGEYLPEWHPWEDFRQGYAARKDLGGGVALTLCHPFDYLRWMLGDVKSVWGLISADGFGLEVEESVEAGLTFSSGVNGTVHLDYHQSPPRHSLEIIGTDGSIIWENSVGIAYLSVGGSDFIRSELPEDFSRDTLFADQMKHFLGYLQQDIEPRCSLEDGIQALKIVEAVKASAKKENIQFL